MPPMRTLAATSLTLEPQLPAHAEAMFAVLSDLAIYRFGNQPPDSLDGLRQRFDRLASGLSPDGCEHWLNWVVRLPDGALAGYVQATIDADGLATIGYELGSAWWGRGIATQAVACMIEELQARYRIGGLRASLHPDNQRSLRLLLRLGFEPAQPGPLEAASPVPGWEDTDCLMRCPLPWRGLLPRDGPGEHP